MTHKALIATLMCLIAIPALLPQAQAIHGSPATLTCSITFAPPASHTQLDPTGFAVDANGDAYLLLDAFRTTPAHSLQWKKISTGCVVACSDQTITTGADSIIPGGLEVDNFGRILFGYRYTLGGVLQVSGQLRNTSDCSIAGDTAVDYSELSPAWDNIGSVGVIRQNATNVNYLGSDGTATRIARINQTLAQNEYVVASAPIDNVRGNGSTNFFSAGCDATNCDYQKHLVSDGSTTDTLVRSRGTCTSYGTGSGTCFQVPKPAQSAANRHQVVREIANSLLYDKYQTSDWTVVTDAQAFTNGKIGVPTTQFDTHAADFDVDGSDEFLVCGEVASTTPRGFVAHYKTSDNDQFWNLTTDLSTQAGSATDVVKFCEFDHKGGFYTVHRYFTSGTENSVRVTHYSGGGFSTPAAEPGGTFAVPPTPTTTPAFVEGEFGNGVQQFAIDIGFSSPAGQFFFGLILVIIVFLVVAGAAKGVSDSAIAAGIGGSIAAMGVMIFNTTLELWPAAATVTLIILTSAVILYLTRGVFMGRGD